MTDIGDKYNDPPDFKEIILRLDIYEKEKNHNEIEQLIKKTFPDWILSYSHRYSKDYPHLQINWESVCKLVDVVPKNIIIVDYINFTEKHKIIKYFCEIMTRFGYCVRRKEEFITCVKCNSTIPVKDLWKKFGAYKDIPRPNKWSSNCNEC